MPISLLVGAGVFKLYTLAWASHPDSLVLGLWWLTLLLIFAEFLVAVWLLIGCKPNSAKIVGQILFAIFFVFAAAYAVRGHSTCGCFGIYKTNPWIMAILDIVAICCLRFWIPAKIQIAPHLVWSTAVVLCCIFYIHGSAPSHLSVSGDIVGKSRLVVLTPKDWVGKELPIVTFIEDGSELMKGKWTVVLYYEDCKTCEELIDHIVSQARPRTALIDLNPVDMRHRQAGDMINILWTRMRRDQDWFVAAPVRITVTDGIVTEVLLREDLE